ncbi:hypothetical protein KPATCC21470_8552 [Kitasatospora purpeofusca]
MGAGGSGRGGGCRSRGRGDGRAAGRCVVVPRVRGLLLQTRAGGGPPHAAQQHGYRQEPPRWTPGNPAEEPEYFSAETPERVGVWVALSPQPDGTITLTMSVNGTDVAYAPEHARPLSPLRPDTEDPYWSH